MLHLGGIWDANRYYAKWFQSFLSLSLQKQQKQTQVNYLIITDYTAYEVKKKTKFKTYLSS